MIPSKFQKNQVLNGFCAFTFLVRHNNKSFPTILHFRHLVVTLNHGSFLLLNSFLKNACCNRNEKNSKEVRDLVFVSFYFRRIEGWS